MRRIALLAAWLLSPWAQAQGALVIAGGGSLPPTIHQTFAQAAGGAKAVIGVVTTSTEDPEGSFAAMRERLGKFGVTPLHLDIRRREQASELALLALAKGCSGFWFVGGDQMRVHQVIVGTPLHQVIRERHEAGAAVGGSSAGAAIMSRIMINGAEDVSDPAPGTYPTSEGLGLLPQVIIDQHFLRRARHNRLLSLVMEHPDHLGVGIDEETAILVQNGAFTVLGNRRAMVFDPGGMTTKDGTFSNLKVHLLGPGQGLRLKTRELLPR